jgi:putative ABC transport system permease protein
LLTLKIASRNILRNARRSIMVVATIAIGSAAILMFGAYVAYIKYAEQTAAVQATGHLELFRNGYFHYGTGSPGLWGIDDYQAVIDRIKGDSALSSAITVVTPIQAVTGIAGNFEKNSSKTFLGTGFVPSERDRMKQWNEYGTGSIGLKRSGLKDDEPAKGIAGAGMMRILGFCEHFGLGDCAPASPPQIRAAPSGPTSTLLTDLADRERQALPASDATVPTIDLLAATAGGAPNIVSLQIIRVDLQPFKEFDDLYVGMPLGLAQTLIYGRSKPKATGIVIQLHRTEDLPWAKTRLTALIQQEKLDLELHDFTELNQQYNQVIDLFTSILNFIVSVMGFVVLFTVSNTMGMSVVERTDEIGTIRALGARRSAVRRLFLVEGALLGVTGATAGLFAAYFVAMAINQAGMTWIPPGSAGPVPLRLYFAGPDLLAVATWGGLILVAIAAAFAPALRAGNLPIVDALRHV